MAFLNSVKNDFESKKHDPMIPKYLFNDIESKPILLIDIPFCNESERVSKQLLKKFRVFTKEKDNFKPIHTLHAKSTRESALVRKITSVKPNEMLSLARMSMKIRTKFQKQPSISFNTLIMFFNEKL